MQHRRERVADAIREVVARVVVEELSDPNIGFVSITRCALTRDLKIAVVYFSVLGGERERGRSLTHLERAAGFIRRRLAQTLNLRRTPELRFAFDELRAHEQRVGELLGEVMPGSPPADDAADAPESDEV